MSWMEVTYGTRKDGQLPVTAETIEAELRKVEARYQRATAKAEQIRQERAALISQALAEGWTHAKIARATGLTRGRIGQMAQGEQHSNSPRVQRGLRATWPQQQ